MTEIREKIEAARSAPTLGEQIKAVADILDGPDAGNRLWTAREYVVNVIDHLGDLKGYSFRKTAKLFCEHTLPEIMRGELPGFKRILHHADIDLSVGGTLSAETLRKWRRETNLPAAESVKGRDGFYSAAELVSLVRAGMLPSWLPHTIDGMEAYLRERAGQRPDLVRRPRTFAPTVPTPMA